MNILSYIKKYRVLIVLISILLGVMFYMFFERRQTYTARAVIRYTNEEAVSGLAPDGTEIDTSEIYSSEVMTRVFRELNLSYDESNMDEVRSGVEVKPIMNEQQEAVQTALTEQGEVPVDKPTTYMVSYTVRKHDVADAEVFAPQILKTMIKVYMENYAERHVNKSDIPNTVSGIYDNDYDYIEMVEVLDAAVDATTDDLQKKSEIPFRSSLNGYSFLDIRREFELIRDINLSKIYAYILDNTVTKDQDVLLSKYQNRIEDTKLSNMASQSEVDGIREIISSYVDMMRESGNIDYTYEYILDQVYENNYTVAGTGMTEDKHKNADVTTKYDALMNKYVKERTTFERALVDIAYNQYIIDIYSGNADNSSGVSIQLVSPEAEELPDDTANTDSESGQISFKTNIESIQPIVSSPEVQTTAHQMIKELTDEIDVLYQVLRTTNQEYNQYAGAENVTVATDVVVEEGMNLRLYAAMAVVLFGIIGCVLAVVVGRLMDVFEYYVYVDKKLGIANRAGCDRYIRTFAKMVPSGMVCIVMRVTEIEAKNKLFGREESDVMIKNFCAILQSILPDEGTFIALNSVGQFVLFLQNADKDYAHAYVKEVEKRCDNYNQSNNCKISFNCGISSSDADEIYDIRRLMIHAMGKTADGSDLKTSEKTA